MTKGKLITIYGINNIGKSTHCKRLVERLEDEGHKVAYIKYPVYDVAPSGPFINEVLRSSNDQHISEEELQMWFAVNRYQFEPELKKLIDDGYTVVAEDYRGTGIAWGITKGLDENWVEMINSKVIPEDFSVLIEGNRDTRAKEKTHVHEQNEELIQKSMKTHSYLADKYGWKRVQLQDKIEDTAELVWEAVKENL